MELFKVMMSYNDIEAIRKWEMIMEKSPRAPLSSLPPYPDRRVVSHFVAVYPDTSPSRMTKIAELAYDHVIGAKLNHSKYMPFIEKIEHLEGVIVEEPQE